MWRADRSKLVKVRLHSNGEDVETPFAEDLGPAAGSWGSRKVRLANVPFLHAKPTYGDVIVVEPDPDGRLTWNSGGVPFDEIGARIAEDGGRWAMIVDYELREDAHGVTAAFQALDMAAESADIAVEGCFAPRNERPGRAYLAVPDTMGVEEVLTMLRAANIPLELKLVHPVEDEQDDG